MGLPVLRTLADCADYHKTVEPYIPQLLALPRRVLDNGSSLEGLQKIYAETNPFMFGLGMSIFLGVVFLITSEINRNYSQVDRMWSILPNLYVVHFAVWARVAGLPHARLDMMAAATTIWSIRLTFNYWRRGGYEIGSEDYRWKIIMSKVPTFVFFLFNITFISFYQSVLIYLFAAASAYVVMLTTQFEPEVSIADMGYAGFLLLLVLTEWISDGQQWHYQTAKYKYLETKKLTGGYTKADFDRGFVTSGLWAYSRHPNFFAEQAIWFTLYQWSCFAANSLYSWAVTGPLLLIILFQGSTTFTESISTGKYPRYVDYQKQVGVFFPVSFKPYQDVARGPKVIRTSELVKQAEDAKATKKTKK